MDPGAASMRRTDGEEDESYTERAAAAAHAGVDKLKERIEPQEARLREAAANAEHNVDEADNVDEAASRVRNTAKELAEEARVYVRENPLTAAALAFAAGVIVISWIRR
jgi:ElaB/YqjD/DUF883 family membrane-anchored ribosome-binding protein